MVDPTTVDESYETSSGLLDEYTGTITKAYFATDARYNDGKSFLLYWEIATTDPENPEVKEQFSVGSGWDSADGGATLTRVDGKKAKFNKSSLYGKILDRVMNANHPLHSLLPVLKSKGPSMQASIWEGLTFEFKSEDFDYGSEIGTKARVMPQTFLGENAQPALAVAEKPAATAAATAALATAAATAEVEVDDVTKARLNVAAKNAADFQAFLDAALEIEGVPSNDGLMASIVDETATGYFATARA